MGLVTPEPVVEFANRITLNEKVGSITFGTPRHVDGVWWIDVDSDEQVEGLTLGWKSGVGFMLWKSDEDSFTNPDRYTESVNTAVNWINGIIETWEG